jgi:hypothetical protein
MRRMTVETVGQFLTELLILMNIEDMSLTQLAVHSYSSNLSMLLIYLLLMIEF